MSFQLILAQRLHNPAQGLKDVHHVNGETWTLVEATLIQFSNRAMNFTAKWDIKVGSTLVLNLDVYLVDGYMSLILIHVPSSKANMISCSYD